MHVHKYRAMREELKRIQREFMASEVREAIQDMAQLLTIEEARELRAKLLTEAGLNEKDVRVRTRSWDDSGTYFAVEVAGKSLYNRADVENFLNNLHPIDLPALKTSTVEGNTSYLFNTRGG